MELVLEVPDTYLSERVYILKIVLSEFLGLSWRYEVRKRKDLLIMCAGDPFGKALIVGDVLFQTPETQWLKRSSLPAQPLQRWENGDTLFKSVVLGGAIPIIYGKKGSGERWVTIGDKKIVLELDVFGSAFFMLTRYEEVVKVSRDRHGRFPATSSLAYEEGFLDRPIINEYVEILWACLKKLWPQLMRKNRQFQLILTHDIDEAFIYQYSGISRIVKSIGGDIIKRRSPIRAMKNIVSCWKVKTGKLIDPYYASFETIMSISERAGLRSRFFFMSLITPRKNNSNYSLDSPSMKKLIESIHGRGHEIGLHCSYDTYDDGAQTQLEYDHLRHVCEKIGITQPAWGSRQHYLRWRAPGTWQNLEDAGIDYDTSVSFPGVPGFRCGICYQYRVFNLKTRNELRLREMPLIVMDRTVLDKLQNDVRVFKKRSYQTIMNYGERCRRFGGDFVLLWHNNRFVWRREVSLYKRVIEDILGGCLLITMLL